MSFITNMRDFFTRPFRGADEDMLEPIRVERPRRAGGSQDAGRQPRFRTSATDRIHTGERDAIRIRLREAFVPSQPVVSRTMFAGRLPLLQQLIQGVEDQRAHVVLYGERGIGKTSSLRVFTEIAREADYMVVHEICGAATHFDDLFRSVAAQIPLLYSGALAPTEAQEREGGSLADLLPSGVAGPNQVSRVLAEITGTRLIIVLDEFDRVVSESFQRDVAELIKNLSDASARVQLVIAGVAENLRDLLGHSPSIRRNVIGISVDRMSDGEIAEIIELGEHHAGVTFEPAARDKVVELAEGRPYLTRLIAHHASLSAVDVGRTTINEDDVDTGLAQATAEMETRLGERVLDSARHWLATDPRRLVDAARLSLAGGGSIDPEHSGHQGGAIPTEMRPFLDRLASSHELVTVEREGSPRRYRFVEDGLPTYLLLASHRPEARRVFTQ